MATEKIQVEVDLIFGPQSISKSEKDIEKSLSKAGAKAGNSFEKSFASGLSGFKNTLFSFNTALLGFSSILVGVFAGSKFVEAANRQSDAVNKLERSLKRIGEFTPQASKELQDYATSIQDVTRFGDEAVIEQLAFAQGLGATADQSRKIVSASVDLATALDIDLNSAVRNISKTLGGLTGELGEVLPELKGLTSEQLKAGAAIDLIADKYNGFAASEAPNFSKSLEQAKNATGDLIESIGGLITKSESGRGILESLTTAVKFYTKAITDSSQQDLNLNSVEQEINKTNERIKELRGELAKGADNSFFGSLFDNTSRVKKELDSLIVKELELVQVQKQLQAEQAQQAEIGRAKALLEDKEQKDLLLEQLKSFGIVTLEQLEQQEIEKQAVLAEARERGFLTEDEFLARSLAREEEFARKRNEIFKNSEKKRVDTAIDANRILGSVVASGTTNFVNSLLKGEKASSAFKDFVLSSFGDMATQLGQFYIATGIAQLKLFALDPTGTIAAGVGLVALGQLLKSFASSGLGGVSSSGGGGGEQVSGFAQNEATNQIASSEDIKPSQVINLTVQGNILDRKESGLELINIINETIDSDNVVINQSFA